MFLSFVEGRPLAGDATRRTGLTVARVCLPAAHLDAVIGMLAQARDKPAPAAGAPGPEGVN